MQVEEKKNPLRLNQFIKTQPYSMGTLTILITLLASVI